MNKNNKNNLPLTIINSLTIIVVLAILGVFILVSGYPMVRGFKTYEILTPSMTPTINVGELVYTSPVTDVNKVQTGDVVAYRPESKSTKIIFHRLIEQNSNQCVTKGDYNKTEDAPIKCEQIVGKVEGHIPYLGRIAGESKIIFVVASLGTLVLLFLLSSVIKAVNNKYAKKQDEETDKIEAGLESIEQTEEENNVITDVGKQK